MPRIPDFSGLSNKGFDGAGNYGMGISDWGWFHEIDSQHQNMGHMNVRPRCTYSHLHSVLASAC